MEYIVNYKDFAEIRIFEDVNELLSAFSEELASGIQTADKNGNNYHIALSGGSTPNILFKYLSENSGLLKSITHVHFYWGDERCVPPDDPESNFGNARKQFFEKLDIPESNIHRIKGEIPPEEGARNYIEELKRLPVENELPVFDLMILGVGEDGHTASIFPDQMKLLTSKEWVGNALHPDSGQARISITGSLINHSKKIVFLATGKSKKAVLEKIFNDHPDAESFPAYHIRPLSGKLSWFIDREAIGK